MSGGILSGGYCPGGYCPDTTLLTQLLTILKNKSNCMHNIVLTMEENGVLVLTQINLQFLVYVETKREHEMNSKVRVFRLGNDKVKEKKRLN